TARVHTSILVAALALAPLVPASAQNAMPVWRPAYLEYTGVVTTGRNVPPAIPTTWITPAYVFHYDVPEPVFVPVPQPRPAVEPVMVATVTLRSSVAPEAVFVGGGTVVTWENGDDQARTLVIAPAETAGTDDESGAYRWQLPANGRFNLAFNQRGSYEY